MNAADLKDASTRQLAQYYEQANGNRQTLQALMLELVQRPSQEAQALSVEIQVELYRLEQGESDESIDWDDVITTHARQARDREVRAAEFADRIDEPSQRAISVLDAWMVTETLTPQVFKQPEDLAQRGTLVPLSQDLPWGQGVLGLSMKPPAEGQSVFYQVYLGDIDVRDAQEELLELYGRDPELKGTEGGAVLAVATFNQQGILVGEYGVGVACFGWSLGRARLAKIQHLPFWHAAERLLIRRLRKRLSPVDEDQRPCPLSYENLQDAADWLVQNLDLPIETVQPVRFAVRIVQSSKRHPPSSPLLNSFLLHDLWRAKAALEKNRASASLLQYLQVQFSPPALQNIQDLMGVVHDNLNTHGLPLCRWPSAGAHSLDALQQTAVNLALQKQSALFSVHGPPGTGKTTLLRDIVAGVLGQRADVLAEFDHPSDAFKSKVVMKIGDQRYDVHPLDDRLLGHEILVCSRNNKAVENISLELPLKREVSAECADLNYFAQTMQAYLFEKNARRDSGHPGQGDLFSNTVFALDADEPWGLIAAALGNGANRKAYVRGVWLDPGHGFKHYFEQMIADWKEALAVDEQSEASEAEVDTSTHAAIQSALRSDALFLPGTEEEALQLWRDARADYCEKRSEVEAIALELELSVGDLGSLYALDLPELLIRARDHVFLAAMRLHQAFILASPHQLLDNISGFTRILLGARGSKPELLPHLWASGMLMTPVISTTFASLQRMLHDMPPASIGWVLIDEAGQASPQDAVGALTRAQQAIVVGDPLQIEPVVSLPHGLVNAVAEYFGLDSMDWMAPDMSVQTLADRVNPFGLVVQDSHSVGWPILVHRRCAEPMFTMMNTLAYQGMMVQGQEHPPSERSSRWLNVIGESSQKWCAEEGNVALQLVQTLLKRRLGQGSQLTGFSESVFVISPFRNVATGLKHLFRHHKKQLQALGLSDVNAWVRHNVGTVHTFQGRQAAHVVLVLGAQGADEAPARHWATRQVNLCNVAVSRAQQSLFVIGNLALWQHLGAMRIIAAGLKADQGSSLLVDSEGLV